MARRCEHSRDRESDATGTLSRLHLFEFADQAWCPKFIRRAVTEYLATATRLTKIYQPTASVLTDLLRKTSENTLLVIGAGSGGGVLDILPELPSDTRVILTDVLPDLEFKSADPRVQYRTQPVDAFDLPKEGLRLGHPLYQRLALGIAGVGGYSSLAPGGSLCRGSVAGRGGLRGLSGVECRT